MPVLNLEVPSDKIATVLETAIAAVGSPTGYSDKEIVEYWVRRLVIRACAQYIRDKSIEQIQYVEDPGVII